MISAPLSYRLTPRSASFPKWCLFSTSGSCCEAADRKKSIAVNTLPFLTPGGTLTTAALVRRPADEDANLWCTARRRRRGEANMQAFAHSPVTSQSQVYSDVTTWRHLVHGFIFRTTAQSTQVTTVYFCAAGSPVPSLFYKIIIRDLEFTGCLWAKYLAIKKHMWLLFWNPTFLFPLLLSFPGASCFVFPPFVLFPAQWLAALPWLVQPALPCVKMCSSLSLSLLHVPCVPCVFASLPTCSACIRLLSWILHLN